MYHIPKTDESNLMCHRALYLDRHEWLISKSSRMTDIYIVTNDWCLERHEWLISKSSRMTDF
jgi:hypothetical protein